MDNTVGSLTQLQKSLIIGSILGDGYIRIMPGRKDAFLEVNHAYSAKEYVDWKYAMLQSIAGSIPKARKRNGRRIAYRFYTRQHPEITELFRKFYRNGRKIIPDDIQVNAVALAVWYMDDGSQCRTSDVYLNTQQFTEKDQIRLIQLLSRMGIESRMNRDKIYWRLRIIKSSLPRFRELIQDYIIPELRYKIEL
ncbi:MAG: LAGLIDADG endonuclease [Patescibacteria group bacterium]